MGLAEVVEVEPVDSGDWDIIRLNQSGESTVVAADLTNKGIQGHVDFARFNQLHVEESLAQLSDNYEIFKGGFFGIFYVLYSTLLHLPPLRFRCVGGFWDRIQDWCDFDIGSLTLQHSARSHPPLG